MDATLPVRRHDGHDVRGDDDRVGAAAPGELPLIPPSPELLEREAERGTIAGRLARAASGSGGCVLVSGPAGIGKSALLDEARGLATVPVLNARGSELERDYAYGAVHQLFGRLVAGGAPLEGAAAHAAGAFSVGGEPDHSVLHGLYWLTAGLGPLVIIVDDVHWLDGRSLRWLAYMVDRAADLPLALVLAARGDEPHELVTRIALHASTATVTPRPLSEGAIGTLAEAALGREPPEGFVAGCSEITGGNPFYVHALLAERTTDLEGVTPRAVVDAIALRLLQLPQACGALARALAILDGAASGTVAARVAGLDLGSFVAAAEALAAAEITRAEAFVHPLVRQAVYATIEALERARLHGEAAHYLAAAGAPAERVAAQVMAGGPGGGTWAVEALRTAARAAWARGAPDVAAGFLRRAAGEEIERGERIALLRELGRALVATQGPVGFAVLREAFALTEGGAARGEIALDLGRALLAQGYFTEAATTFEAGLAAVGAQQAACAEPAGRGEPVAELPIGARLEAELATVAVLDLSLVRRFGGLDGLAARLGAGASAVGAWIEVAHEPPASTGAGHAEAALAAPGLEPSAVAAALVALMAAGRLEQADAHWTGVAEAARAAGALETLRLAVALRALVRLRQGRVSETLADLGELVGWVGALDLPHGDHRPALPWIVVPLVDAHIERGELEEAQRWVTSTGLESDWPEIFGFTFLLEVLARLRLAQGRVQDALRLARECGRRQRAWGLRNPGFLAWRTTLATALAATGRTGEALDLCDEQVALARAFGVAREEGMALLALGTITHDTATLHTAVATLQASPARLEHARALAALGTATHDREPLREALELAERCGASALATQARDALVATGAKPRRAQRTGAAALTAAQLGVARLAAEGGSNRAIAETLFLSEKTVEGHLGAAYRKLGIAKRAQLGGVLDL
jgi:DNA-binding NarL/FixJ family response regulator